MVKQCKNRLSKYFRLIICIYSLRKSEQLNYNNACLSKMCSRRFAKSDNGEDFINLIDFFTVKLLSNIPNVTNQSKVGNKTNVCNKIKCLIDEQQKKS